MLSPSSLSRYSFTYDNRPGNPVTTDGTSVIPGASHAEGDWTAIASSANIAQDCYWIFVRVSNGSSSNAQKDHLLDIGVDPAGGTSYAAIISDIVCGQSIVASATVGGGHNFLFPFYIKAGSAVAARIQGSNATAGTVRVSMRFYGQPSRPEAVPVGQFSETIGTITDSSGVSFTPGTTADGTWVSLGTTAKAMWWWQLCYQLSTSPLAAEATYIDLAFGDATNKHIMMRYLHLGSTAEQIQDLYKTNLTLVEAFHPLPAGTELWVRGRCDSAPDSGYNAVAVGIGG
jgi:hypothetical protein